MNQLKYEFLIFSHSLFTITELIQRHILEHLNSQNYTKWNARTFSSQANQTPSNHYRIFHSRARHLYLPRVRS